MKKKKILVKGPALTRSGYGEQTRFAFRALRDYQEFFDIFSTLISITLFGEPFCRQEVYEF